MNVGINLAAVTHFGAEPVFANAVDQCSPWYRQQKGKGWDQGPALDLDARGNVLSLLPDQYAESYLWINDPSSWRDGVYAASWDGPGKVTCTVDAKPGPAPNTFQVTRAQGQVAFRVTGGAASNIRITRGGSGTFDAAFLDRWRGAKVVRFMDWQRTNNSPSGDWSKRPLPSGVTQAGPNGVSLERCLELCAAIGAVPWFCVPHLADDDWVRQFGLLVKASGLKAYVEYGNENWNGIFAQAKHCAAQGALDPRCTGSTFDRQMQWSGVRSAQVFAILAPILGKQLVRVVGTQVSNPYVSTKVLEGLRLAGGAADVLAVGAYWGNRFGDPATLDAVRSMTPESLLVALQDSVDVTLAQCLDQQRLAAASGLTLAAYEAGQHLCGYGGAESDPQLSDLFQAANRHPGMGGLFKRFYSAWPRITRGVCCPYSSMTRGNGKSGYFGLLEGPEQSSSPKYDAFRSATAAA